MNHEQELIKSYYDEKEHLGFAYAYQLPGMNKVLQAGGRVIRGMADQGIVVLADQRFARFSYRHLFPQHWQTAREVRSVWRIGRRNTAFLVIQRSSKSKKRGMTDVSLVFFINDS